MAGRRHGDRRDVTIVHLDIYVDINLNWRYSGWKTSGDPMRPVHFRRIVPVDAPAPAVPPLPRGEAGQATPLASAIAPPCAMPADRQLQPAWSWVEVWATQFYVPM